MSAPIKVDSQTVIVLEIHFPGGFEGNSNPGEFVLTSVDAQFQAELSSTPNNTKVVVPVTPRPTTPGPTTSRPTTTTTSIWPNGKAYLFNGSQYVRYDPTADKADPGYPAPIAGNWPGFPAAFQEGVDAEVVWNHQRVYFFKGSQYLVYDIAADRVAAGYPLPIAGHWPGLWTDGIDAGVVWPNGKAYFFRGSKFVRYDIATDKADPGYPADIRGRWPGFPPSFAAGIDDVVVWNNGKAYFFKGSEYIRYDIASDKTDPGYPQPIAGGWRGLGQ
jgi:Hemopexin